MPTRKTAWSQLALFLVVYTNLVSFSKSSPVFSHSLQFSQCKPKSTYTLITNIHSESKSSI